MGEFRPGEQLNVKAGQQVRVETFDSPDLTRHEMLILLRGQITLIRQRAARGISTSDESLIRAEALARSLESLEAVE